MSYPYGGSDPYTGSQNYHSSQGHAVNYQGQQELELDSRNYSSQQYPQGQQAYTSTHGYSSQNPYAYSQFQTGMHGHAPNNYPYMSNSAPALSTDTSWTVDVSGAQDPYDPQPTSAPAHYGSTPWTNSSAHHQPGYEYPDSASYPSAATGYGQPLHSQSVLSGSRNISLTPGKYCEHCLATRTPMWRREPGSNRVLCNACGLYQQQKGVLRPIALIEADETGSDASVEEEDPYYAGPRCSHCRTTNTSVWRRSPEGNQVCNACGVYRRTHGRDRPLTLKKSKIRPRSSNKQSSK